MSGMAHLKTLTEIFTLLSTFKIISHENFEKVILTFAR